MDKLKRIMNDRYWTYRSKPLKFLTRRLIDMSGLQVSTVSSKIPESAKNEAKKQTLVMLVACYESYVREIFKILVDEKLVSVNQLTKINKLKDTKFNLNEIEFIKNNKIKLSEIVCEYINFQNFGQMMNAFSVINLDKRIEEKINKKKNIFPPIHKHLPNKKPKKEFNPAEWYTHEIIKVVKQKRLYTKKQLYRQLNLLLEVRHKIIHKNVDIKIRQPEIPAFEFAVIDFAVILDSILNDIRKRKTKLIIT